MTRLVLGSLGASGAKPFVNGRVCGSFEHVFLRAIKTTAQTAQCCPTPCNTRDRGVGNSTEPPSTAQSFANHSSNLPFSALLLFRGPSGPVRTVAIGEHFCPISSMSGGNFATLDALGDSGVSLFVKVLFWGRVFLFPPLPLKQPPKPPNVAQIHATKGLGTGRFHLSRPALTKHSRPHLLVPGRSH